MQRKLYFSIAQKSTLVSPEAEGSRELSQHGVLPCLAGGEYDGSGGGGGVDLCCDGWVIPPAKGLFSCELLVYY
jgi:hypothetical protein